MKKYGKKIKESERKEKNKRKRKNKDHRNNWTNLKLKIHFNSLSKFSTVALKVEDRSLFEYGKYSKIFNREPITRDMREREACQHFETNVPAPNVSIYLKEI